MIERVIRAIEDSLPGHGEAPNYEALARAVIMAMREPSDVMIEAACEWADCEKHQMQAAWHAAIEAALSEGRL
jgi:hypothetical protein